MLRNDEDNWLRVFFFATYYNTSFHTGIPVYLYFYNPVYDNLNKPYNKKMARVITELINGMKNFGKDISLVLNTIILLAVYLIGIGTTSIIAKAFRKRFFNKGRWTDIKRRKKEDHFKQF